MLNKESEILYWFAKEPWKKYTFTQMKKVSRKKSRSYMASVLGKLAKNGILKRELFGHLPVYSLNMASAKARIFAGFVLESYGWSRKHIPYGDMQRMMDKIPALGYVFIITGSYARGKQTEKSDIDVAVLIDDNAEPKKVYAELSFYCELSIPKIHLYVFRNREFTEMLFSKEENYGKEISRNNLLLAGGQFYIKLVCEAVLNGYNG